MNPNKIICKAEEASQPGLDYLPHTRMRSLYLYLATDCRIAGCGSTRASLQFTLSRYLAVMTSRDPPLCNDEADVLRAPLLEVVCGDNVVVVRSGAEVNGCVVGFGVVEL